MKNARGKTPEKPSGLSPAVKALAKRLASEQGMTPLSPGMRRPLGFFTIGHFSGRSGHRADAEEYDDTTER